MLSFQKLGCAIEFLGLAAAAAEEVPRGNAALLDQLRRAASSIPLNIAEAAGRTGQADAARTYAIARGSAMECVRGCAGRVVRAEGCRCHDKAARRRPPRTYRRDAHAIVSVI